MRRVALAIIFVLSAWFRADCSTSAATPDQAPKQDAGTPPRDPLAAPPDACRICDERQARLEGARRALSELREEATADGLAGLLAGQWERAERLEDEVNAQKKVVEQAERDLAACRSTCGSGRVPPASTARTAYERPRAVSKCRTCDSLAASVNSLLDELRPLEQRQSALFAEDAALVRQMREDREAYQEALRRTTGGDREQIGARQQSAIQRRVELQKELAALAPQLHELYDRLHPMRLSLNRCNASCVWVPFTLPRQDPPPSRPDTATPAVVEACPDCPRLAELLLTAQQALDAITARVAGIRRDGMKVAEERAAAQANEQRQALDREAGLVKSALDAALEQEGAARRERDELQKLLDECSAQCRTKIDRRTGLNPTILGTVAGAGGLVALLLTSGDPAPPVPAVAPSPPVAPTQTAPSQPPPTPQPPPPAPQPTIAGLADCTRCEVMDDSGRHNVVINLCPQLTGAFDIAVGSITIRHPAPFVDIVGAQYDTAGGAFRGAARGTVAGFPNVGITAEGTANAETGSIVFTYTMGTGGELPGGRPITYRITLQKRR